jgi:hypothetical protein
MTFAEWVASSDGAHELVRGHYIEHIRAWLRVIRRDQLFIVNFQSLIEDTTTVMDGLTTYLGLSQSWGKKVELPKPHAKKPSTFLDCATFDSLNKHYMKVNAELARYVNSGRSKPAAEPYFPAFKSVRSSCLKHDPNVDDDEVNTFDDKTASDDDKA